MFFAALNSSNVILILWIAFGALFITMISVILGIEKSALRLIVFLIVFACMSSSFFSVRGLDKCTKAKNTGEYCKVVNIKVRVEK